MGYTRYRQQTRMGSCQFRRKFQSDRKLSCTWTRCSFNGTKRNQHRNKYNFLKYFLSLVLINAPAFANNTISSPSASSSGTVINNGYQTINGNFPTHRYSNGIQCQLPTLAFTPFITQGENFSLPRSTTSRTNIYDTREDDDGNLINPGEILYVAEQERLQQNTYNLNYGATLSFQIPLGKSFNEECLAAAKAHRKTQEFVLQKSQLEANLARLKICAEQMKLGVKYVGEDAITCKNVVLTTIPNQVLPHRHPLSSSSQLISSPDSSQ